MNIDLLKQFLVEAKKKTYANEDIKKEKSSRKASSDYEYSNGIMTYHDTYFGGTNFIGEEVVYLNDEPIWAMNYYGVTLDKTLSEEMLDKVLRKALMNVGKDDILPLRGPKEFINGKYKYCFKVTGDLKHFSGEEMVYLENKKIYSLICHGGEILK